MDRSPAVKIERRQGIIAAPGVAIGPAALSEDGNWHYAHSYSENPSLEMEKFESALQEASRELEAVRQELEKQGAIDEAEVIDTQVLILHDETLRARAAAGIAKNVNAEAAWMDAIEEFATRIAALPNATLAERAADVRDAGHRVLSHLQGRPYQPVMHLDRPSIILATDLSPSQTAVLDRSLVLGLCTAEGGPTSHTAIFARAFGLPALVGLGREILSVEPGSDVILDAEAGELIIHPGEEMRAQFRQRSMQLAGMAAQDAAASGLAAITQDGHRVDVFANIGGVEGAKAAVAKGAEGVGLLRTEFLFLERNSVPDENEQYQAYAAILEVFEGRPVILRTADIGGDKPLPYLELPAERNPFLGERGLRLALAHPKELLEPQLRAALRAAQGHDLRLMFPMVTTLSEIRQAQGALAKCRDDLRRAGMEAAESVQVGIMVEVPSAAIMADALAPEVDFFSIGTNDLSQYVLAADRTNPRTAGLGSAFSPAVLRLIRQVITEAHRHGKRAGACGELAGEPLALPILLGMDLDEFSMNPTAIPRAKSILRGLNKGDCAKLADEVLRLSSAEDVRQHVKDRMPGLAGD